MELNNTLPLNEELLSHSTEWTVAFVILYVLILLAGLLGNGTLVIAIYCKRELRNVINCFIFNLAVADLLVIVFCIPATLAATIFTPWLMGDVLCKVMPFIQTVSVCASAYSLVAISINRCQGMYRPLRRGQGFSNSQAYTIILIIWIVAFALSFPLLFVFQLIPHDDTDLGPFCVESWTNPVHGQYYFAVFILFGCYFLPLSLISLSNMLIWCKVSRRQLPHHAACITPITKLHRKTKLEVKRMLTLVTFTFLSCWLPLYSIVTRLKLFPQIPLGTQETNLLNIMIPLSQLLGSFNGCVNPVIYAFVNTEFRKIFKTVLFCSRQSSDSILSRNVRYRGNNTVRIAPLTNPGSSASSAAIRQSTRPVRQRVGVLNSSNICSSRVHSRGSNRACGTDRRLRRSTLM